MVYGAEAVLLMEISLNSLRVKTFDPESSLEGLSLDTDLLEEVRYEARATLIRYQDKVANYFNKKVKTKHFQVNDLVLRESASSQSTVIRKFKALWEGPYKITKILHPGT